MGFLVYSAWLYLGELRPLLLAMPQFSCKKLLTLVPQVPSDITTLPTYDQNRLLNQLIVQWSHEVCYNGILLIMRICLMTAACAYL